MTNMYGLQIFYNCVIGAECLRFDNWIHVRTMVATQKRERESTQGHVSLILNKYFLEEDFFLLHLEFCNGAITYTS